MFFSSLLFLGTSWRVYLRFFLATSWISRAFWLSSTKFVLIHLFTMCCSDCSHYWDPGYLAGKYGTMSAAHDFGLTFCYQCFTWSFFFTALPVSTKRLKTMRVVKTFRMHFLLHNSHFYASKYPLQQLHETVWCLSLLNIALLL